MPVLTTRLSESAAQSELAPVLAELREEFDPGFTDDVLAEAASATAPVPELDLRELPFATLDPAGARDLDQAFHLERAGDGYRVRYAIADVPGFVTPDGAVDREARRRGVTLYAADGNIPLHPEVLSEGHASLLPNVDRPAIVWTFELDAAGAVAAFMVARARIRSVAQLDYLTTQADLDAGRETLAALLPEIGKLRIAQEAARGGASLNMPESEVVERSDGTFDIVRRHPLPVEDYNAQLSLMTGMAAAKLMLEHRVGILRTMPEPQQFAFETFRHQTKALGRPWTVGTYGDYLRTLDHDDSTTLPILEAAGALFRGSGYVAFDGELPHDVRQAAVAAPYAHVTAPLRRLVDRWGLAICLELAAGRPAPEWARKSLTEVPGLMQEATSRAATLNTRTRQHVEAALLAPHVGERFTVTVVARRSNGRASIQLAEPPVSSSCVIPERVAPGERTEVELVRAEVPPGRVEFVWVQAREQSRNAEPDTSRSNPQQLGEEPPAATETARGDGAHETATS